MISGGTSIIHSNVIPDVLMEYSKIIIKSDTFPLDSFKSQTLVIASKNGPMLSCDRTVRLSNEIGDSRIDYGRIGTPIMNKEIWSVDDNFSVQSASSKRINSTLAFSDLRPMKGIRHLHKMKKKL